MRLRFDFWRPVSKGNTPALMNGVMEHCASLPEEHDDRLLQRETKVIRLHRLEKEGALWLGDFVGIGTKKPAKKAHVSGRMENVSFQENEGLGEESAFLYDPQTNVLILQSNRLAATASSVISFLERFAPSGGPLDLQAIMDRSATDALSRFRTITKLSVNMAAMDLGRVHGDKKYSVTHLASIASELSAPSIKLDVSVGHGWRTQGLSLEPVKRMIHDLMSARSALNLKTIEISGRTDDEDFEALDLITQRLKDVVLVDPDEGRAVSRGLRWANLREIFEKRRAFLTENLAR
jgi:hypothetical protein